MTNIRLCCRGATAKVKVEGQITAGAVGIPVAVEYDSAWDGLVKKIVFRTEKQSRAAAEAETITVPWELLEQELRLQIGVVGRREDGKLVIPTVWADCGRIRPAAADAAQQEAEPTPSLADQILVKAQTALTTANAAMKLVQNAPGGSGAAVTDTVEEGNMNAVTSNAVYRLCGDLETILSGI